MGADADTCTKWSNLNSVPGRHGIHRSGARRLRFFTFVAVVVAASIGLAAAEPVGSAPLELELTLAECIVLAIRSNRDLAAGRLDRLAQRLTLENTEDEFRLAAALNVAANVAANHDLTSATLGVSPNVRLRIPTGGTLRLSANSTVTPRDTASQFVELEFVQPFLKGGGVAAGTAGVVRARRTEEIGLLAFESAVTRIVTRTIYAYRNVIKSMREVEIAERSLQRANDLLTVNRVLIEAGRMAEQDIVQTEASVAERELSLTEARVALNDARLALIAILDIDSRTRILPTEALRLDADGTGSHGPDADRAVELALQNRPDYLRAVFAIENANTAVLLADNARQWELDLTTSARFGHSGRSLTEAYSRFDGDYRVGFRLRIPLGADGDALRRNWQMAEISWQKSRLQLQELRQAIDLEVRGAVADIEIQFRRIELARQSRRLAERKLEVERLKLDSGLSTNFQLVTFEDDLVRSQNREVGAIIAYLDALTALDVTLGTTLDTWQIDIDLATDGEEEG